MRRHGVKSVLRFLILTLRRTGWRQSMRMAAARSVAGASARSPSRSAHAATAARPPDFDVDYSVSLGAWNAWLRDRRQARSDAGSLGSAPTLHVLREGDRQAVTAAQLAGPEAFLLLLKMGDAPSPDLPGAIVARARGGRCDIITFDLWSEEGGRVYPVSLPGANPTLLAEADYIRSRLAVRAGAVDVPLDQLAAAPSAWLRSYVVRTPRRDLLGRWRHLGTPLVRIGSREAAAPSPPASVARRPSGLRSVSVVICTKDKGHLTRQLVRRLLAESPKLIADVVIVSNNTSNPYALRTLDDLSREPRVHVLRCDIAFSFSKLANAGAHAATGGELLLFLNDDIAPISETWIERLVARLDDPVVGVAGPLLLYPDERVQHAGMFLGFNGNAGHTMRAARLPQDDYLGLASFAREVSCVTGAALMTPRTLFEALNGFDEQLPTYLQDVDYGLRVFGAGFANVFEPSAVLFHMESTSILNDEIDDAFHARRQAENERFMARWGEKLMTPDPFHPQVFDVQDETLRRLSPA